MFSRALRIKTSIATTVAKNQLCSISKVATSSSLELDPRHLICEQLYPANAMSPSLSFRVELLNRFDSCLVCRFGIQNIRIAQPLAVSLHAPADDLEVQFFEDCQRSVHSDCSVIAFPNDAHSNIASSGVRKPPAGMVLCSTQNVSATDRKRLNEFEIRKDYCDDIESAGYLRRNASRVHVLLKQLKDQLVRFVPVDANKIGTVETYCIHPSYEGVNLESSLIKESMKLSRSQGVQYLSATCATDIQRNVFEQLGFENRLEFPLACFLDGDASVFKQLPGEKASSKLSLMITKLPG